MSNNIGKMMATLGLDTSDFDKGVSHAKKEAGGLGGFMKNALSTASGFALASAGINSLGSAFSFVKNSVFGFNSSMQQADIAFTQMLGSAEKSKKLLGDIQSMAAKTPFELPGLVSATQRMINFGFNSDTVLDKLKKLGDAAAASPDGMAQALNSITLAIGQMNAKGKVSGGEMLQLVNAGVPAWEVLAKVLGTDVSTAMKKVESGTVMTKDVMDKFIDGIGNKFPNMMEKQSHSFAGLMSTIQDNTNQILGNAFKPLFDASTRSAEKMANFLGSDAVMNGATQVANAVSMVITKIGEFTNDAAKAGKTVLDIVTGKGIGDWAKTWESLPGPIKAVTFVLLEVENFVARIGYDLVTLFHLQSGEGIVTVFGSWALILAAVKDKITELAHELQGPLMAAWAQLQPVIEPVLGLLKDNIGPIVAAITTVATASAGLHAASAGFGAMSSAVSPLVSILGSLPLPLLVATAVLAALYVAWDNNFLGMRDKVQVLVDWIMEHWPAMQETLMNAWDNISSVAQEAFSIIMDAVTNVVDFFQSAWPPVSDVIQAVWDVLQAGAEDIFPPIMDFVTEVVNIFKDEWPGISAMAMEVWNSISEAFNTVVETIKELASGIVEFFQENGQNIVGTFERAWDLIVRVVEVALAVAVPLIQGALRVIQDYFDAVWPTIVGIVKVAWDIIHSVVEGAVKIVGGIISAFAALVTGDWGKLWDSLGTILSGALEIIYGIARGGVNLLIEILKGIGRFALEAPTILWDAGKAVVQGLIKGIEAMLPELWEKVKGMASGIKDKVSDILHIFSPSRDMAELGQWAVKGLIVGISKEQAELASTVAEVINKALDAADKALKVLPKLAQAVLPDVHEQFGKLASVMADAIGQVFFAGKNFNQLGLEHVGNVADAAGKIFDAMDKIMDVLKRISQFSPEAVDVDSGIAELVRVMGDTLKNISSVIDELDSLNLMKVSTVSESAGGLFDALKNVLDVMQALVKTPVPANEFEQITRLIEYAVKGLGEMITYVTDELNVQGPMAAALAENAGKVFDGIGKVMNFFEDFATLKKPINLENTQVVADLIREGVTAMGEMVRYTDPVIAAAAPMAGELAKHVGEVFTGIGKVLDVFSKLTMAKKDINFENTDKIFSLIEEGINGLGHFIENMNPALKEQAQAAAEMGKGIKGVFDALDSVLKVFQELDKTMPLPSAITPVLNRITDFAFQIAQHFIDSMPQMDYDTNQMVNTVAPAIEKIMKSIQGVLQIFLMFAQTVTEKVKTTASEVEKMTTNFNLIDNIKANLPKMKAVILEIVTAMMEVVDAWLDTASDLKDRIDDKTSQLADTISKIIGSVKGAFDLFKELGDAVTESNDFDATQFFEKEVDAWRKYREKLAELDQQEQEAIQNLPSAPTGEQNAEFGRKLDKIARDRAKAENELQNALGQIEFDKQKALDKQQKKAQKGDIKTQILKGIENMKEILQAVLDAMDKMVSDFKTKFADRQKDFDDFFKAVGGLVSTISGVFDALTKMAGNSAESFSATVSMVNQLPGIFSSLGSALQGMLNAGITQENVANIDAFKTASGLLAEVMERFGQMMSNLQNIKLDDMQTMIEKMPAVIQAVNDAVSSIAELGQTPEETVNLIMGFGRTVNALSGIASDMLKLMTDFNGVFSMVDTFSSQFGSMFEKFAGAIDAAIPALDGLITKLDVLIRRLERALAAALRALLLCTQLNRVMGQLQQCMGEGGGATSPTDDGSAGSNPGYFAGGGIVGGRGGDTIPGVLPSYATGGFHGGGWAMVGENGREMVWLPRGAVVLPNSVTRQLLRQSRDLQLPNTANQVGADFPTVFGTPGGSRVQSEQFVDSSTQVFVGYQEPALLQRELRSRDAARRLRR